MPYEKYRKDLIQGYYDHQLETLMSGFDPDKPTVILLPGGMGSQLERSEKKYPASPNVINDVVWLDGGVVINDAPKLEITAAGEDLGRFIIAAYGPVSLFGVTTPYGELEDFARDSGWNYSVFGYDWRRSLKESAEYFATFILAFQKRVIGAYGAKKDPIPRLTIVCHSMGGMVCTYALSDSKFSGLGFNGILTIATPFYGTSTQQERYYVGMPGILNGRYGAKTVARLVASLPGPYTLMFLPKSIYDRDGQKLGLSRYPEIDPYGNAPADPYNAGMLSRWPQAVKDHKKFLIDAVGELEKLSQAINANIAPYFFNVRSSLDTKTAVELMWNNINGATFVPGKDPSPLTGIPGPGDGTVPAWSAWHAYCRPKNRYELKQAKDHGNLLEHDEVLGVIEMVVKTRKLPTKAKAVAKPPVASKKKVDAITAQWVERAKDKQPPPAGLFEDSVKRAIVADLIGGPKPKMAGAREVAAATAKTEGQTARKRKTKKGRA